MSIGALINEPPLVLLPSLAKAIGLNNAIVLQQIHYWLKSSKYEHDGSIWIYNSVSSWCDQFPFWSDSTIKRALNTLRDAGLIKVANYNKAGFDKTLWYTIDYAKLILSLGQVDPIVESGCTNVDAKLTTPIPETTADTTTDNNTYIRKSTKPINKAVGKDKVPQDFEAAWSMFGKYGTKTVALRYWYKLSEADKQGIMNAIPIYLKVVKAGRHKKNFEGWINPVNRKWEEDFRLSLAQWTKDDKQQPKAFDRNNAVKNVGTSTGKGVGMKWEDV